MNFRKTRYPLQGSFNVRPNKIVTSTDRILNRISVEREPTAYIRRFHEVQKVDKRPFTLNYDATKKKMTKLKKIMTKDITETAKKELIKYKHDTNANAVQETQLIGFHEFNKESLEGIVDLEKVKEIRRAIRRRYASRGNLQKIFNLWDENHRGSISWKEAFKMLKKFEIKANEAEVKVLVASADHDKDGELNLDEFLDLIYNDNEALNVDLKSIAVVNDPDRSSIINMLDKDLQFSAQKRKYNQLMLVLKSKIPHFVRFFKELESQSGNNLASKQKLEEAIRASGLSEQRISPENLDYVFSLNSVDNHLFDFRKFVNEIKDYKFVPQYAKENQTISEQKNPSSDVQNWLKKFAESEILKSKEFNIIDVNSASLAFQEKIINGTMKISRYLRKVFPNESDINDFFADFLQVPREQVSKETIEKQNLRLAMETLAQNLDEEKSISKDELEHFCSSLNYNNQDKCSMKLLLDIIYKEDKDEFFKRVWNKKSGPPPTSKREHIPELINSNSNFFSKTMSNGLFDKIDKRFFSKNVNCIELFRVFDSDKDGFITHEDIISRAEEKQLIKGEEEANELISYMDPENKGFLTISDFNRKFRKDILLIDESGKAYKTINLYPNKEYFDSMRKTSEMAFSRFAKANESFEEVDNPYSKTIN